VMVDVAVREQAEHLALIRREPPGTDFYLMGFSVPSFDSEQLLQALFHSRSERGGRLNATRYANAEVDRLIDSLAGTIDFTTRTQTIAQLWRIVQDETIYIPLHIPTVAYAMKADINIGVDIENQPKLKFLRLRTTQ
jgi:peptide/nickel transport system substrate-binding protein